MAAPSMTYNTKGNIANATALGAGATSSTLAIDASAKWELQLTVEYTAGGTVAATAGIKVLVFTGSDTVPDYETVGQPTAVYQFPQPVASTTYRKTLFLPTGKYGVTVTNLDVTNAITSFSVTTATIDSVA